MPRKYKLTPLIEPAEIIPLKGKYDYTCSSCTRYITPEHGGIKCRKCGHLYCCDPFCVDVGYLNDLAFVSQSIGVCHKCEGVPEETKETTIIQVKPITGVQLWLAKNLGKRVLLPQAKSKKLNKKEIEKIEYYEL